MTSGSECAVAGVKGSRTGSTNSFRFLKITNKGWNQKRSPPPALLTEAGVPDNVWYSTFDSVLDHEENITKLKLCTRKHNAIWKALWIAWVLVIFLTALVGAPIVVQRLQPDAAFWAVLFGLLVGVYVPIFLLGDCRKSMIRKYRNEEKACFIRWSNFVLEQNGLYYAYDLQVKMLRARTSRHRSRIIGALSFEKEATPLGVIPDAGEEPSSGGANNGSLVRDLESLQENGQACPTSRGRGKRSSLVQDLESLQDLHRSGALTDEEYSKAKSTVLTSPHQDTTEIVQAEAEVVQGVIHAQAVTSTPTSFSPNMELPPLS